MVGKYWRLSFCEVHGFSFLGVLDKRLYLSVIILFFLLLSCSLICFIYFWPRRGSENILHILKSVSPVLLHLLEKRGRTSRLNMGVFYPSGYFGVFNWLPLWYLFTFLLWIWAGEGNYAVSRGYADVKEFIGVFSAGGLFFWDMESFIFCYSHIWNLFFSYSPLSSVSFFPLLLSCSLSCVVVCFVLASVRFNTLLWLRYWVLMY